MSDPSIRVHADGSWVAVPVDGEKPDAYGPAAVAEFGDTVPEYAREALSHDLAMFAGRAQQNGAIFAAVMLAESFDSILAYTECLPFDPAAVELPSDVDAVLAELATTAVEPPGWREVSRRELPAGPAARIHLLDADRSDAETATSDRPVVESVTHLVPATPAGPGIVLMTSWPALLAADELVAEADRLASTLTVTP